VTPPEPPGPPADCYTPGGFISVFFCWIAHLPAILALYFGADIAFPYKRYLILPLVTAHTVAICLLSGIFLAIFWRLEAPRSRDEKWRAWRVLALAEMPTVFFAGWWPYILIPFWPWLLEKGMRFGYACWFKGYWRQWFGLEPPEINSRT
jgi:hypothetical protein